MEKKQMLWYDEYAVETFQQKGGETMDYILRFLVSVMASVAGYYIRKWLDPVSYTHLDVYKRQH